MKRGALLLAIVLVQLVQGDDLYWRPNSNWDNPSNWKLGRVPCGSDVASIPENSMVFVNQDATFQTIILPDNGEIILGANIAINLSEDSTCGGDGPGVESTQAPSGQVNEYVGAVPRYWECGYNWLTVDNFPAEHSPCGADTAIFEEDSYFHFVTANETIFLRSLRVRGSQISSQDELDDNEFSLNINIIPECGTDPSRCPCPSDQNCAKPSSPEPTSPKPTTSGPGVDSPQSGGMSTGTVVGIVIGVLIFIVLVAIVIVVVVILIVKRMNKGIGYKKDDFLEHEEQNQRKDNLPELDTRHFDNPVYESTTLTPGDMQLPAGDNNGEKPKLDFKGSNTNLTPDMDGYQNAGEVKPGEEDFVKVDLGAMSDAIEAPPPSVEPNIYEPVDGMDSEMVEDSGKKKGKKGNYQRF